MGAPEVLVPDFGLPVGIFQGFFQAPACRVLEFLHENRFVVCLWNRYRYQTVEESFWTQPSWIWAKARTEVFPYWLYEEKVFSSQEASS